VQWSELAWPEIGRLLESSPTSGGQHVGLVPVGATEQHGPHLPTGTDTIIATGICDRAAEQGAALSLPAIPVAVSYGHGTQLPGTLSLPPELVAQIVRHYALWAATSGLRRLLFVNSHLGNAAALGMATDELRLYHPELRVGVVDWWSLDRTVAAEATSDGEDIHANRAETAMMLALAPELVHTDRLADADDEDRTGSLVFRYTAPALSRNGVTGRPSEATPELGQKLLQLSVSALVERLARGRTEEPPLGIATPPTYPV
jgi:creatinine amidohydrolase